MKTVLVTGASGGIGSAAALELARRGWNVALHYRSNQAAARQADGAEHAAAYGEDSEAARQNCGIGQ